MNALYTTYIFYLFSAVSVGFAVLVINTAGLGDHFIKVYFTSLLIAFFIAIFMVRIPPLSKKPDVYFDGRVQNSEELKAEGKMDL